MANVVNPTHNKRDWGVAGDLSQVQGQARAAVSCSPGASGAQELLPKHFALHPYL